MEDKKIVFVLVAICLTEGVLSSARSAVADALWKSGRLNTLLWLLPDHVEGRLERGEPDGRRRAAIEGADRDGPRGRAAGRSCRGPPPSRRSRAARRYFP